MKEEREVSPYEEIVEQQKKVDAMNRDPLGLSPDATSLDFHQAVYRNPTLPIPTRQRSAIAALQFEHPKLAVTAVISEGSFADRLDKAVERSNKARNGQIIVNGPKLIEAQPQTIRRRV
jgi:hypothetical protein